MPASSPWLVNDVGEPLCTVIAPPPYSYDPNGSDLPRVSPLNPQWYHQSCWQQAYPPASPEGPYTYQHYPSYLSQDPTLHEVEFKPPAGCDVYYLLAR
ncbi:hypothetical protein LDENG_00193850 [Lucifuga dentata]|nr:hypothetical protein LDENG_00193850 [Lucifuga dentata]